MPSKAPIAYAARALEIDIDQRELRIRGVPVAIGGRAFEIIQKLAESDGELVRKNTLIAHAWPGITVEENTLQVHIAAIRKALGSDRALLKTTSGRGYRLLGDWRIRDGHVARQTEDRRDRRTTSDRRTNLPTRLTNLVGRSAALKLLRDLLSAYRVITLTGPGGIGKTALAIDIARDLLDEFVDGSFLIELATSKDPSLVASIVAGAIRLKLSSETISADAVARAIGTKQVLLVLDNCEHVVDAAANLAEVLVRDCPDVTVLATSRQPLDIAGEFVYRVRPLDIPASDHEEPGILLGHSAVELFVARTRAIDVNFTPQANVLSSVSAICRHLDGIPLAIEFAAARAATLGVRQVAAGLSDRFELLKSRRRTALPRHQTLRATLDWSYALLPTQEQSLLRQLSIFAAGFSLDAAKAVADPTDPRRITDDIANLVTKSLIVFDGATTPNRWRLLETIRAYALEKLTESGDYPAAARRQAEHFRDMIVPAVTGSIISLSADNVARCSRELDNVRSALDWSFSPEGDPVIGKVLTAAFAPIWTHMSLVGECCARVEHMYAVHGRDLNLSGALERQMCFAYAVALGATMAPVDRARAAVARAVELAQGIDSIELQLQQLWAPRAWVETVSGNYATALTTVRQLAKVAQSSSEVATRLMSDRYLGTSLLYAGQLREAQICLQRVVDHYSMPGAGDETTRILLGPTADRTLETGERTMPSGRGRQCRQGSSSRLRKVASF